MSAPCRASPPAWPTSAPDSTCSHSRCTCRTRCAPRNTPVTSASTPRPARSRGVARPRAQPGHARLRCRVRRARASPPTGVHFSCENRIPIAAGMGSSAAATLRRSGGDRHCITRPGTERQILDRAEAFEGHLDNVAAALLGGLVICSPGAPAVQRIDVARRAPGGHLHPAPASATAEARQVVAGRSSAAATRSSTRAALRPAGARADAARLRRASRRRWTTAGTRRRGPR